MRDWLSHRVAATPDAEALVLAASGESLTYAELDARAEALASRLAGLGVEPGDNLAVVLANRGAYVALVHAAMRLGVRLVPCSDRLTTAELSPKLDAADATAVVCGTDTESVAVEAAIGDAEVGRGGDGDGDDDPSVPGWRSVDGFEPARVDNEPGDGDDVEDDVENVAEGSNEDGDEDDVENVVEGSNEDGDEDDVENGDESVAPTDSESLVPVVSLDDPVDDRIVGIDAAPDGEVPTVRWGRGDTLVMLFTSGSTGNPKLVPLTMGNVLASATASTFRLGVLPEDRYLATLSLHHTGGIMPLYRATLYGTSVVLRESFEAGGAVDDIRRYDVTGVSLVPTMLSRMLDARGTLPDSLRTVLLGGAPAPDELIERCRDYSIPVHPTYGMTEAASQIATARPSAAFDRIGTVGRPLLWTDVTVRDDDGAVLPAGEHGELVVSGPSIAPGYYRDEAATDAALTDDGALRTGDVGYRDEDGYVYVLNRLDDRIISGGENVDPGEVSAALGAHPEVDEVAVAGLPDDEWGERVAALVVTDDPDSELDAAAVESFCRDRLAGFKIPQTIAFAEEIPRTVSGTVDRPAVQERLERARETAREALDTGAPDEATEKSEPTPASESDEAPEPAAPDADGADVEPADTVDDSASGSADADGNDADDDPDE